MCFSEPKEPVFWEVEYDRGLRYYRERYFRHWSGECAVGEGRVFNLYLPYVPERIAASLPDAKLIAILRNPVDRAYSHWWHRVTRGYEQRSFAAAVGEELTALAAGRTFPARECEPLWRLNFFPNTTGKYTADLKRIPVVEMGHYAEQLGRYYALFPAGHLKVLLFEDFVSRPQAVLAEICAFLNIDPTALPTGAQPQNVALESVKGRLAFGLERISWKLGVHDLVPKETRTRIRRLLSRQRQQRPPVPTELRRRLADHYVELNRQLEQLIDRDLAAWNASAAAATPVGNR